MCGICGVVQVGGEPRELVSPEQLDAMTDVMTHRGPNDRGTYASPGIALGVRRLSIVDVEGGHQPFLNEERSVVAIQNGELYNHADLRRELERDGHVFWLHQASRGRTDTSLPRVAPVRARRTRCSSVAEPSAAARLRGLGCPRSVATPARDERTTHEQLPIHALSGRAHKRSGGQRVCGLASAAARGS
jgi:Glutamine amidotransferase domain